VPDVIIESIGTSDLYETCCSDKSHDNSNRALIAPTTEGEPYLVIEVCHLDKKVTIPPRFRPSNRGASNPAQDRKCRLLE
jgi:hypothetical protein